MSSFDDLGSPIIPQSKGSFHPINQIKEHLLGILSDFGFEEVSGTEIESEEFNFDMLNIKETHPARQMHDTFYVEEKIDIVRTHTSPVQIEV